ncbi:MAG: hypothetical protein OXI52_10370 [Caldilineaceae bacterium]|nr:hypothetical protein [Caldilineaceae bacterium]
MEKRPARPPSGWRSRLGAATKFSKKALAGLIGRGILEAEISGELHLVAGVARARRYSAKHDVTLRGVEGRARGRPAGIRRALQRTITERTGMFCAGLSWEERFDDPLDWLKGDPIRKRQRKGWDDERTPG